ncbi:MAG: energy transducer TonB [Candidatus Binatia bacterium]
MHNPPLRFLAAVAFFVPAFVGLASAESPLTLPEGAERPIPFATNAGPSYPPRFAVRTEVPPTVTLQIVVERDGSVRDPRVVDGAEPFASAALRAAERWRYEPARLAGRPIAVPWRILVRFEPSPQAPDRWQVYRRERRDVIAGATAP